MDERTDERLLRDFTRGDDGALGVLADRHEAGMLGLAKGLLGGSEALGVEAVQDAWVRVIRSASRFRGDAAVRTWLYRVVLSCCAEVRKREARARRRRLVVAPGDGGGTDHRLGAAMEGLTDEQRTVMVLCFGRGLSHTEVAAVLGVPVGTVKSRSHAAMERLRAVLGDESGGGA